MVVQWWSNGGLVVVQWWSGGGLEAVSPSLGPYGPVMGQSWGLAWARPITQTVLVGAVWTAAAAAAHAVEASEAAGAAPGIALCRPTATTHTKQQLRVSHQPASGATKQKNQHVKLHVL
jgi:hypothetical protein